MLPTILQKLQETIDNPGFYRPLTPEEQAELFLALFAPKPKLFEKPKVIKGIDGYNPVKDQDYLSKETTEKLLIDLVGKTKQDLEAIVKAKLDSIFVRDGRDAVITDELITKIAEQAQAMIVLPDFANLITMEPEAIRNSLELLNGGERLHRRAIDGLDDYEEIARLAKTAKTVSGGITQTRVLQLIAENAGESTPTFETVSKNLSAFPNELNYTGDNLTTIVYTTDLGTVTKTLAYTGENLTTITLSGDLPSGLVETVKTLSYTGENLSSITYS